MDQISFNQRELDQIIMKRYEKCYHDNKNDCEAYVSCVKSFDKKVETMLKNLQIDNNFYAYQIQYFKDLELIENIQEVKKEMKNNVEEFFLNLKEL